MDMLEELVTAMHEGHDKDPVEVAAEFLRKHEGRKIPRVRPQYIRMRAGDLDLVGCKRSVMASILGISDRHVYNLLKQKDPSVQ